MNIAEIRSVERKYQGCKECSLCENRKSFPHFGMGHPEGSILVVIPAPILGPEVNLKNLELYDNSPIQKSHKAYKMLTSIMKASDISKLDLYVVPTVMCPSGKERRPTKEEVLACKPRLLETITAYNPKILILCGPMAYYSWYESPPTDVKYGVLYDKDGKTIYYIHM